MSFKVVMLGDAAGPQTFEVPDGATITISIAREMASLDPDVEVTNGGEVASGSDKVEDGDVLVGAQKVTNG